MKASQLSCVLNSDSTLQRHVLGVHAKDTLPMLTHNMLTRGVGLIVNTENTGSQGRHWIVIYIKGRRGELFDSLAEPVNSAFHSYLKSYVGSYLHIVKRLQSSNSALCGFYCLYFLLCKVKNTFSLNQIVESFDENDLVSSEVFVCSFICSSFKHCILSCTS